MWQIIRKFSLEKGYWMRRLSVLVLAVIAGSTVAMFAANPAGSQQPAERQSITLFDPRNTPYDKDVDNGKEGFSPGDEFLFIETLKDPDTCEKAGRLVGHGQVVKFIGKNDGLITIDVTADLENGKILGGGAVQFSEFETAAGSPLFAVTGGTKTYRDASGEVSFGADRVDLCGTRGDLITFDLGPQP